MKKTAKDNLAERTRRDRWKLRTSGGKEKKDKFLSGMKISIFDYFYCMRINANYRGFRFIEAVEVPNIAKYFDAYFRMTQNFYKCFEGLRARLEKQI